MQLLDSEDSPGPPNSNPTQFTLSKKRPNEDTDKFTPQISDVEL